LKPSMSKGD